MIYEFLYNKYRDILIARAYRNIFMKLFRISFYEYEIFIFADEKLNEKIEENKKEFIKKVIEEEEKFIEIKKYKKEIKKNNKWRKV